MSKKESTQLYQEIAETAKLIFNINQTLETEAETMTPERRNLLRLIRDEAEKNEKHLVDLYIRGA